MSLCLENDQKWQVDARQSPIELDSLCGDHLVEQTIDRFPFGPMAIIFYPQATLIGPKCNSQKRQSTGLNRGYITKLRGNVVQKQQKN